MEATVADGKIVDAKVTSEAKEGSVDMLTDETRAELAKQIVEKQDVDAISGVTISSDAVKEAVAEILGTGRCRGRAAACGRMAEARLSPWTKRPISAPSTSRRPSQTARSWTRR